MTQEQQLANYRVKIAKELGEQYLVVELKNAQLQINAYAQAGCELISVTTSAWSGTTAYFKIV